MTTDTRASVLVVEDRPEIASLYETWLSEEYDVTVAHDGTEAIERFDPGIEVAILDRRLPGRSGDEVLSYVREHSDCRVAMVTAVDPDFEIIEMRFDEYVVKPLTRGELIGTVERLLARDVYADSLQQYFALVSKRGVLEEHRTDAELEDDRYHELEREIEELERELDTCLERFEHRDFEALFRSIDDDPIDPVLE